MRGQEREQEEQKLAAQKAYEEQRAWKEPGISGLAGAAGLANCMQAQTQRPMTSREKLMRSVDEAIEVNVRRLATLQTIKDKFNRSSDYDLDLVSEIQELTVKATT
jgi:hypothetical protein